jgi:hypothetical protein
MKHILIMAIAIWNAGCSLTAMMVPVEGPLSLVTPTPVIPVKVTGIQSQTGALSFTLPHAETCTGRWSSAGGASVSVGGASLLSQYGAAYISGYGVSTSGGQNPGQALGTCGSGRTFQMDFVTGGSAHGFGIGKDNEGNVYRFIF